MHKYFKNIIKFLKVSTSITAILGLIWGSFTWADYSNLFSKSSFVITGNAIIDESEYLSFLSKNVDCNTSDLLTISTTLEEHPYVSGVRVSNHFPKGILIEVAERYPVAMINTNPILLIDNQNTVLPFRSNSFDFQIPILSNFDITDDLYAIGKKTTSQETIDVVQFLNRMQIEYPQLYKNMSEVRRGKFDDYELILLEEPTKIVIGKSITWSKMLVLQEFEKSINGQKTLTDYSYLDLRYNNQVITKERRA